MKYELKEQIEILLNDSGVDQSVVDEFKVKESVSPFNYESRAMAYLLSTGKLSFNDYVAMDDQYCKQSKEKNKYLYLFDMAPRTFGQTWGEKHIRKIFPEFLQATKNNLLKLYPKFDGEFDLWIDNIRVEVKACRANSTTSKDSLSNRAYSHREAQEANFKYHYQQLKPTCCDVFIWIGVCKDELLYWVLTSEELKGTNELRPQHRNEKTGVADVEIFEGQVFMTEEKLAPFMVNEADILKVVKEKGGK